MDGAGPTVPCVHSESVLREAWELGSELRGAAGLAPSHMTNYRLEKPQLETWSAPDWRDDSRKFPWRGLTSLRRDYSLQ